MNDAVIRVENLSKRYRIGKRNEQYGSLRENIMRAGMEPFRRIKYKRSQNQNDDTIWALKNVSFSVDRGEIIGIIGRNGAGKSTLLKILSRITKPTSGRAVVRGRVGSLLEVGTGFHPELTGRENIYLNGAILGMKKTEIDLKFDDIVSFAEIETFLDTPVKRYSSGMYVRLAFAVAAHLEPEILLVDEVLAVGDFAFQKKCIGIMGEAAKGGRTVLFVSHNMNVISRLCSRALLCDSGNILEDGETSEVIQEYLDMHQNHFEGFTLDEWNAEKRPRQFFNEIIVNDISLPAELVIPAKGILQIRISGDSKGILLRHYRLGIHITTLDGNRIITYGTPWSSLGDIHIDGGVVLNCTIEALPLIPGKYFVSFGCSDDSGRIDWLENVCVLNIMPGERISGRIVPTYKIHGYFLTESDWKVESV